MNQIEGPIQRLKDLESSVKIILPAEGKVVDRRFHKSKAYREAFETCSGFRNPSSESLQTIRDVEAYLAHRQLRIQPRLKPMVPNIIGLPVLAEIDDLPISTMLDKSFNKSMNGSETKSTLDIFSQSWLGDSFRSGMSWLVIDKIAPKTNTLSEVPPEFDLRTVNGTKKLLPTIPTLPVLKRQSSSHKNGLSALFMTAVEFEVSQESPFRKLKRIARGVALFISWLKWLARHLKNPVEVTVKAIKK